MSGAMQQLIATDWTEWTAIGTFIAAAAGIALAAVTAWLAWTTRSMVNRAGEEITLERQRAEDAIKPHVFPAPAGDWGVGASVPWRHALPVTNGGPGVALNVKAELRWPSPSGVLAQTLPTSLASGESRDLVLMWGAEPPHGWGRVHGALYYNDVPGALWGTEFRIHADGKRHMVEVMRTFMIRDASGKVVG